MIITHETMLGLNDILSFNYTGIQRDWDIEFADRFRVAEFINIASSDKLSTTQRYAVVSLVLASYNEYLKYEIDHDDKLWNDITNIINADPKLYAGILNYWSQWDELNNDDLFYITLLTSDYLEKNN